MRLRWLVAIPAIYIAVAVISGIIWGFSATFSLGVGASAFVIAAIFMLWARFGRQPSVRSASEDEPFAGYPEGHVLAAVPTGAVDSLESDLRAAGFREHDVLSGLSGEAQLDPEGVAHGTTERVERAVERLFADVDDLRGYRDVVAGGDAVIRIPVESEEEARTVTEVLKPRGAYQVHYFGSMVVQRMDATPRPVSDDARP